MKDEEDRHTQGASAAEDVYKRLAVHLCDMHLGWYKYPPEGFEEGELREIVSPEEAEAMLAIPSGGTPLDVWGIDEIAANSRMARERLEKLLNGMASRGLLFTGTAKDGREGYALLRRGYGFPQTYYWTGQKTVFTKKIAEFQSTPDAKKAAIEANRTPVERTKNYRYVPVKQAIDPARQAVYPFEMMDEVIKGAELFALCHCSCRIAREIKTGKACGHPTEVCMKFDELAEWLIKAGLGRRISREEAFQVVRKAEEVGLVHFVDNSREGAKHNCNCCGCACWNVGAIRRRLVPRDMIMATYFIRETDYSKCIGCGQCEGCCPVKAVHLEDDVAKVDLDWCIGCGVCVPRCPNSAIALERRTEAVPPRDFEELHARMLEESSRRSGLFAPSSRRTEEPGLCREGAGKPRGN